MGRDTRYPAAAERSTPESGRAGPGKHASPDPPWVCPTRLPRLGVRFDPVALLNQRTPRMNPIAEHALDTLAAAPEPALRLSELHARIGHRVGRKLDPAHLRTVLESDEAPFRVLDAWPGRWVGPGARPGPGDPWVVAVSDSQGGDREADLLRESVRWLARAIDARSQAAVSRWCSIVLAERSARATIRRTTG